MFDMYFTEINYAVVFGTLFGMYLILQIDTLVKDTMTFVKGWRSNN